MIRISTLLLVGFSFCIAANVSAQEFRVQIAAYAEKMPDTFFTAKGIQHFVATHDQMGMYRYFAGSFATREEADEVQQEMVGRGFPFASVVDLEEQRVLCGTNCPYTRNGRPVVPKDPNKEMTVRNIYFDFGSANLSDESKGELNKIGEKLKGNTNLKLKILGHADAVGDAKSNMELAATRARTARNYLINRGIRADRMYIKVFGESAPEVANSEEDNDGKKGEDLPENRKWNRRVVLALTEEQGEDTIGGR